ATRSIHGEELGEAEIFQCRQRFLEERVTALQIPALEKDEAEVKQRTRHAIARPTDPKRLKRGLQEPQCAGVATSLRCANAAGQINLREAIPRSIRPSPSERTFSLCQLTLKTITVSR